MTLIDSAPPTAAAPTAEAGARVATEPPRSPEAQASTERYLGSGDRMAALLDPVWKLCVGLMVLIVVAWALGVLPGAVRLF
jgi:hypothetical protein